MRFVPDSVRCLAEGVRGERGATLRAKKHILQTGRGVFCFGLVLYRDKVSVPVLGKQKEVMKFRCFRAYDQNNKQTNKQNRDTAQHIMATK